MRLYPLVAMAVLAAAGPALTGCATIATLNVRAQRAYSNEEPALDVVRDRVEDVTEALALADRLLAATPYTPGDAWLSAIALDSDTAKKLKAEIAAARPYADGEHEVPIVKLYRLHLTRVLAQVPRPGAPAPRFPSLLDAMAGLSEGTASIKQRWASLTETEAARADAARAEKEITAQLKQRGVAVGMVSDPPELAAAKRKRWEADQAADRARKEMIATLDVLKTASIQAGERAVIARDALAAASVVQRVHLEGIALAPTVVVQANHAVDSESREIFGQKDTKLIAAMAELPPRAEALEERMNARLPVVEAMTSALTAATGQSLVSTAGYKLRESLVDQIVGIDLDSIHGHLKEDNEVLFYNQLGYASSQPSKKDPTTSYAGRTQRLGYQVDPIVMIGARAIVAFDWIHVKNAGRLNGGFTTDRLFSSGGTIDIHNSLGELIGLHGLVSDIFDMGADLIGIRVKVKVANFTSGQVTRYAVDPGSDRDQGIVDKAPFQLAYTQLDIGYDVSWLMPETAGKYWIEDLLVGFRYMNYRLPRVLYELTDVSRAGEASRFVFDRESPPQVLTSKYFMGGFTARFGQGDARRISLFGDIGGYAGAGPMAYYFLKDPSGPNDPSNQEQQRPIVLAFNATAGLGARLRITPRLSRVRLVLEGEYRAELVSQTIISAIRETQTKDGTAFTIGKKIDFGGSDVFHGPTLQVVGSF